MNKAASSTSNETPPPSILARVGRTTLFVVVKIPSAVVLGALGVALAVPGSIGQVIKMIFTGPPKTSFWGQKSSPMAPAIFLLDYWPLAPAGLCFWGCAHMFK